MRKGRIENWQEIDFFGQTRLVGNVYECDAFPDGEMMISSPIEDYQVVFGRTAAKTESGSTYMLGNPAESERTFLEIIEDYINASE